MADETKDPNRQDPAYRILRDAPIESSIKGDLWDDFWESRSAADLNTRLERFDLDDDLQNALIVARKSLEASPLDRAVEVMHRMRQIPEDVLKNAEAHPQVLKLYLGQEPSE